MLYQEYPISKMGPITNKQLKNESKKEESKLKSKKAKVQVAYDDDKENGGSDFQKDYSLDRIKREMASMSVEFEAKKIETAGNATDKSEEMFFCVDNLNFKDLHDFSVKQAPKPKGLVRRLTAVDMNRISGHLVLQNKKEIAVFRHGNTVFAIDERCPHAGGPLHLGDIENVGESNVLCIVCPWHKWKIELTTGKLKVPARPKQTIVYPVKVSEEGHIYIGFKEFSPAYFEAKDDF